MQQSHPYPNPFEIIFQKLSDIQQSLHDIKHGSYQQHSPTPKQKLNIHQLSEYTGIPVNTLYGMSSRGELPCSKPSKRLIFDKSKIDEWLEDKRKKTAAEIQAEAENFLSLQK